MCIAHEFFFGRHGRQGRGQFDDAVTMGPTHPGTEQLHGGSANDGRRLIESVGKVIGVQNTDHVREFLNPRGARGAVPIQVFRFFEDTNIVIVVGDE